MAIQQTLSQLILAVGIDSRCDENFVTGDAVNCVAPPINLGVNIFDDNAPAAMLGFQGHPQLRNSLSHFLADQEEQRRTWKL